MLEIIVSTVVIGILVVMLGACAIAPLVLSGEISEREEREEARRKDSGE